jgi:hypothetical protein
MLVRVDDNYRLAVFLAKQCFRLRATLNLPFLSGSTVHNKIFSKQPFIKNSKKYKKDSAGDDLEIHLGTMLYLNGIGTVLITRDMKYS